MLDALEVLMSRTRLIMFVLGIPVAVVAYVAIMGTTGACPSCARIVEAVVPSSSQVAMIRQQSPIEAPGKLQPLLRAPVGTLDGGTVTLESFAGKPILIEVWATWCAPCVKARKILNANARSLQNVATIIGISVDTIGTEKVKAYLARNPSPGMHEYMATPEFLAVLAPYERGRTIPKFVYVAPDGKIIDIAYEIPDPQFAEAMLRNLQTEPPGADG